MSIRSNRPGHHPPGDRNSPRAEAYSIRALRAGVAPFLLLVTPFVVFVTYHAYGILRPEVGLSILALAVMALALGAAGARWPFFEVLAIAGSLTLFADIQLHPPKGSVGLAVIFTGLVPLVWILRRHAARIVGLAALTVLASVLLLPPEHRGAAQRPAAAGRPGLPLMLHLILDEHIGVEGLPADLTPNDFRRDLQAFYRKHGFLLFGGAFSEYVSSYRSISHLVNFKSGDHVPALAARGTSGLPWDLKQNAYFNLFARRGYAIRVYQPDYMDMCADKTSRASCHTYLATTLRVLAPLSLTIGEKALVVAGMYLDRSSLYAFVRQLYLAARTRLATKGLRLPAWSWERNRISSISTMPVLDAVRADLSRAQPGDFIFAHLMLPHYPYTFDAECRPRRPRDWLERVDRDAPDGTINSRKSRALRYARYLEQVACVQRKLEPVLAAIPPSLQRDAIVIVQGDHGSRIALVEPGTAADSELSPSDYADSYSTLFAVRSPRLQAGYDVRQAPIACLLRELVATDFESASVLDACTGRPTVFVSVDDRLVTHPLPAFGYAAAEGECRFKNGTDRVLTRAF